MATSSLVLMLVYTLIALVIQGLAIGAIVLIEPLIAGWSGVVFMASYLIAFWIAWVIAVWLTEPRKAAGAAA
jgi:hypothetical protein